MALHTCKLSASSDSSPPNSCNDTQTLTSTSDLDDTQNLSQSLNYNSWLEEMENGEPDEDDISDSEN